jgi:hypothetical protein
MWWWLRDDAVHGDVVGVDGHRWDELGVEADAELDGAGVGAGEEAVVMAGAASEAVAIRGEGEAGDDEEIDVRGGDEGAIVRVRLEDFPWAHAHEGEGWALEEVHGLA